VLYRFLKKIKIKAAYAHGSKNEEPYPDINLFNFLATKENYVPTAKYVIRKSYLVCLVFDVLWQHSGTLGEDVVR
jgi:hypothetical protein